MRQVKVVLVTGSREWTAVFSVNMRSWHERTS